ncbi:hypothetical protein GTO89_10160 [Heliobacterium gestii]|uniref:Uncharacterized protein n=1 Tax=Heliomicrobium gestii TaxID=2699 RepID=A0A845LDF3_HELGE|nr:hypothetical protein [Heliomicrobium gestii]MBM7868206.1 hypothetical protein [Heliomicrobium gestii]MZP43404.1 hypothetical protein [Heliomicrobium gestii]
MAVLLMLSGAILMVAGFYGLRKSQEQPGQASLPSLTDQERRERLRPCLTSDGRQP